MTNQSFMRLTALDVNAADPSPNDPWCPRTLWEVAFGWSSGIDEPAPRTYLLLDGALRTKAAGTFDLDVLELPARSLFQGVAAEDYASAAPYLLDLTPPTAWRDFGRFWGRQGSVVIRSHATLDEMRSHLRRFTRMKRADTGAWALFRFWDARVLLPYLEALTDWPARAASWTSPPGGPAILSFVLEGDTEDEAWLVEPAANASTHPIKPGGPLSDREIAALSNGAAMRFERGLARGLSRLEPVDPAISHGQWMAFARAVVPEARAMGRRTQQAVAGVALLAAGLGLHFLRDERLDADARNRMISGRLTEKEFFDDGRALQDDLSTRLAADGGAAGIRRRLAELIDLPNDPDPLSMLNHIAPAVAAPLDATRTRALIDTYVTLSPNAASLPRQRRRIAVGLIACYGVGWTTDPRYRNLAKGIEVENDTALASLLRDGETA